MTDAPLESAAAVGRATTGAGSGFEVLTWVNGQRQPQGVPHISARDRGFTLADGVFETMRVVRGRAFRLDRHLARLRDALARLGIREPASLTEHVIAAAASSPSENASLRLTVSRGVGPGGLVPPDVDPTVVVAVAPMPAVPARVYLEGLSAYVPEGRRNERSMTNGLKTLSYTDAIAGLRFAVARGGDEALFLDSEDHCSEASASNLFIRIGGALVTPPVSCGALPGITRAIVMELAHARGVEVREEPFGLETLHEATEAFLTSSLRGIAPLVRVDDAIIGRAAPGDLTQVLADTYAQLVEQECA